MADDFCTTSPVVWLVVAVLVVLLVAGAVRLVVGRARRTSPRVRLRGDATVVEGVAWVRPAEVSLAVLLVVALVGALLGLAGSTAATPPTSSALAVVALAVLALVASWRTVGVVARRRRRAEIALGTEALVVSGPGGRQSFAWTDLVGVRPHPLALLGHAGTSVPLPAGELLGDPEEIARLVEHYRSHPTDRPELADGRALQRVRDGRLG